MSINYEKSCDSEVPAIGLTVENELELIFSIMVFITI